MKVPFAGTFLVLLHSEIFLGAEYKFVRIENCSSTNPSIVGITRCVIRGGSGGTGLDFSLDAKKPIDEITVRIITIDLNL